MHYQALVLSEKLIYSAQTTLTKQFHLNMENKAGCALGCGCLVAADQEVSG